MIKQSRKSSASPLLSYIIGADTGVLRGKKVRTTISRKAIAAGDRVNRQFVAERPDQLWVADFTYGVPGVQGGHGCLNEPRVCLEY
ncbi:transposase for insertion sequence element [Escherichia coli]|uniref:Transposase for insertion sequence element n=1 Tax=Escherichia coli TaxID=562 RepID=A0A485JM44_ECOLX|nr:transposase for insertion sequence element [Escherichia coli]